MHIWEIRTYYFASFQINKLQFGHNILENILHNFEKNFKCKMLFFDKLRYVCIWKLEYLEI